VACVSSRNYYCRNPTTKVLDCYDDSETDCPAVNISNPDSVTWTVSPADCTVKLAPPSPCNSTIKITSRLIGGSDTFSVQLDRN